MNNAEWRMLELKVQRDLQFSTALDCERDGCLLLADAHLASALQAERMLEVYRANWFPVGI